MLTIPSDNRIESVIARDYLVSYFTQASTGNYDAAQQMLQCVFSILNSAEIE